MPDTLWDSLGAAPQDGEDPIDLAEPANPPPRLEGEEEAAKGSATAVPTPRFGATEGDDSLGEALGFGGGDEEDPFQALEAASQSDRPANVSVAPQGVPVAKLGPAPSAAPPPRVPAARVPIGAAHTVNATRPEPAPQSVDSGEDKREQGVGVSEPDSYASAHSHPGQGGATPRRGRWSLVAAVAGGLALVAGIGTVAVLKTESAGGERPVRPLPQVPAARPPEAVGERGGPSPAPNAPRAPHMRADMHVFSAALPGSRVGHATAGLLPAGTATETARAPQGVSSLSGSPSSAGAPSAPLSLSAIRQRLGKLERSFKGIELMVGQIARQESALALAVQKNRAAQHHDAMIIARQGREIAHLTWLLHHEPRPAVPPLARRRPAPRPKPKPLVPPVHLVGIIGHTAWIAVPDGALVRLFRGNPIPGTPLSVRVIQADPPLVILSNGVRLREETP